MVMAGFLLFGVFALAPPGALASGDHDHEEPGVALGPPTVEFTLWAYVTGFEDGNGNKNPTLTVSQDDVVKVTIISGENVEHNFVIEELEVHSDHVAVAGEQVEVTFLAESLGEFAYICNILGHRAFMEGTLVVREVGGGSPGLSTPLLVGILAGVALAVGAIAMRLVRNGRKSA